MISKVDLGWFRVVVWFVKFRVGGLFEFYMIMFVLIRIFIGE